MKAYIAHAMTGRSGEDMLAESKLAAYALANWNIEALDPVIAEGITPAVKKLGTEIRGGKGDDYERFKGYWKRDKEMIREAHVLIDMTPHMKSEGVSHEIGYARYFLWKPVVRVGNAFPLISVAHFEDDILATDIWDAAVKINDKFGTFWKRFVWRVKLYNRCILKALWYKLGEWK